MSSRFDLTVCVRGYSSCIMYVYTAAFLLVMAVQGVSRGTLGEG